MFSITWGIRRLGPISSVAVSTARLRVCGASSWTQSSPNAARDRLVVLFNASTSLSLNVYQLAPGGDAASAPIIDVLPTLSRGVYLVPGGDEILVNRDAASSDTVTAQERTPR